MKLNGYIGALGDREGYLFRDGKTDYQILIPAQAPVWTSANTPGGDEKNAAFLEKYRPRVKML